MNHSEIKALVSLLEDDDYEILEHVEQKIVSLGDVMIPFLETEWETNFNPEVQRRIEELLHTLHLNSLKEKFLHWKEHESENLLKGIFLVANYQYPDLDYQKIKKELDKIYYEVWLNHRPSGSPFSQVSNIAQTMFNKLGFNPNTQNFHSPANSMINSVLESRKGNPISLCVIFMLIAQRLKMPIFGVNLPNLFILTYTSEETQFYINAFNRGAIFSKKDIDNYIKKLKIESEESFYQPCTHLDIIQRILRNVIVAFENVNESEKVKEIKELLRVIS